MVAGVMFEHPERIRLGSIYIETSTRILGEIRLELGGGIRYQDDVGTEAKSEMLRIHAGSRSGG